MRDERSTPSSPPPPPAPLPSSAYTPPPPRPRRSAWFWIAIIGGCCGLLILTLFFLALFIPSLLSVRKRANEASTVLVLHAIGQAEANYNVTYPANGYACTLAALGGDPGSGAPTVQAAQLIDPTLAATGRIRSASPATKATARTRMPSSGSTPTAAPTAPSPSRSLAVYP